MTKTVHIAQLHAHIHSGLIDWSRASLRARCVLIDGLIDWLLPISAHDNGQRRCSQYHYLLNQPIACCVVCPQTNSAHHWSVKRDPSEKSHQSTCSELFRATPELHNLPMNYRRQIAVFFTVFSYGRNDATMSNISYGLMRLLMLRGAMLCLPIDPTRGRSMFARSDREPLGSGDSSPSCRSTLGPPTASRRRHRCVRSEY